jgi:hypothetical protein
MTTNSRSGSAYRSHAAKRLARYLRAETDRSGDAIYVNGDRIAAEIGHAPAEAERLLRKLAGSPPGLRFSLESGSPRPVWRVSRP